MRIRPLALLLLLFAPVLAQAPAPRVLLQLGEFEAAWTQGRGAERLGDLAAAAEAANLIAQYRAKSDAERRAWLERAQETARRAIRLFPDAAEGYYQLAHAQAEVIRFVGVLAKLGLASEIKRNLERALELDAGHARAVMGLALWHLQLAKRGFGWLYGASLGEVVPLFEWAVTLEPDSVEIRKNYGFALMQLGRPEAARKQLEAALALPVKSVPDRLHHDRAAELLRELERP
ncbi:tetratricopeptide repeat protein [Oceanithermus desulfurans]|uniref:Tetratricopeptide repeat protein n=2 Tax=Oceanithermus desulfurans TaxID=227924 RepID=A0A511RKC5_9DEIN|nr:tetratricopeptide repeat protein [Oceanithermus desulfurans]MBB6030490.1 tetratricopeptide (TPR) repeat protein [Oceanithermus desulfurans]GEM90099.1 hypothetical protein ODE01S_15330 [Oceanithermus desulfurans NBRC 100063]